MTQTESSPPSAAAAAPRPPAPSAAGGVKETVEAILVAFILAFIFRAFVVEAFVIPTGSMAPTLLGAHMRYRCPDCGYEFAVNYQSKHDNGSDDIAFESIDSPATDVHCPNCGYLVSTRDDRLAVHYGDRILVQKYLYLLHDPTRWDVVVFKSPAEPERWHYTQNFIKRLIGKPGESVMVLDGDVYIKGKDDKDYAVQTKPDYVQDALWRVIYDNDYHPNALARTGYPAWHQPWQPTLDHSGWDTGGDAPGGANSGGRVFSFDNAAGAGTLRFDPTLDPQTHTFNEYLVYDVSPSHERTETNHGPSDSLGMNTVSDLKLRAEYARKSGDGPLRLRLAKLGHSFTAEVTPAGVRLLQSEAGSPETELIPAKSFASLGVAGDKPVMIEFQNVDYRVSLRLNGKEVLATTPQQYHPDMALLMDAYSSTRRLSEPSVEITADHQTCTLAHVGLWRDIYYTNRQGTMSAGTNGFGEPMAWASPDHPVVLGNDEYFVMGDNSVISGDARYWTSPIHLKDEALDVGAGRVPGRFLLGKAFFVYWPAGFRPLDPKGPAVVPNFGQMRFIH